MNTAKLNMKIRNFLNVVTARHAITFDQLPDDAHMTPIQFAGYVDAMNYANEGIAKTAAVNTVICLTSGWLANAGIKKIDSKPARALLKLSTNGAMGIDLANIAITSIKAYNLANTVAKNHES